jgi:hypothetical protein
LESKPTKWRCTTCKANKVKAKEKVKEKVKEEKEEPKSKFEGEHDDDCFMCFEGGGEALDCDAVLCLFPWALTPFFLVIMQT